MKPDTRLTILTILIASALLGFVAFLVLYPFEQAPRALLDDNVMLEYGMRNLGTTQTVIAHILDDGTVFVLGQNVTVTTLTASELSELTTAIAQGEYRPDRRSFYATLSQTRCRECTDTWLVINKDGTSMQVVDLDAPDVLATIKANI